MHEEKGSESADQAERQAPAQPLSRRDFASALHRSLRHYPRLETLEDNPLLDTRIVAARLRRAESPETPAQALREAIREQCQSWANAPKTAVLERVLRLTYLDPLRSQQAVADTLNMSWSTYRRRLAEARELLTTQLWQTEQLLATEPARKPEAKKERKATRPRGRQARFAVTGVVGVLVVAGLLAWHFGPWHAANGAQAATPSIAVLPFENLSTNPDNAYFAAGIQDEILTRLASIGSLKVISRTSTAHYTSRPDDLPRIARQLGVTTVLEGSVQKSGDEVHINVQLIDARTQAHIWAHSYNRKLDKVFNVEGEVAQEIADALNTELTATEAHRLRRPPTRNPLAYDHFLRGRYYANRAYSSQLTSDYDDAIKSYKKAIGADPDFALAYARLSLAQSAKLHVMSFRGAFDAALAKQIKTNAERAARLAPDLAQAQLALGYYRDYALHDTDGQLAAFKAALVLDPHSPESLFAISVAYENQGHFKKAITNLEKALVYDPQNIEMLAELAVQYMYVRRYADAEATLKRALSINPASVNIILDLVTAYVLGSGDVTRAIALINTAPASVKDNPVLRDQHAELVYALRGYKRARRMFKQLTSGGKTSDWSILIEQGDLEWAAGNRKRSREYYRQAVRLIKSHLKSEPNSWLYNYLGWAYARLGMDHAALEQMRKALKLNPMNKHPKPRMNSLLMKAQIEAQLGHVKKAVDGLRKLFDMPSGYALSVSLLRVDPNWDSIQHDPRFQALLKQYGQSASAPRAAATGS